MLKSTLSNIKRLFFSQSMLSKVNVKYLFTEVATKDQILKILFLG